MKIQTDIIQLIATSPFLETEQDVDGIHAKYSARNQTKIRMGYLEDADDCGTQLDDKLRELAIQGKSISSDLHRDMASLFVTHVTSMEAQEARSQ